jgi:hypothetical protein
MPVQHVANGCGDLAERVGPVDGGCDLAGLDEFAEGRQVCGVLRGDEGAELLADEWRQQVRPDLPVGAAEPPSLGLAADDDEPSVGGEGAAQV